MSEILLNYVINHIVHILMNIGIDNAKEMGVILCGKDDSLDIVDNDMNVNLENHRTGSKGIYNINDLNTKMVVLTQTPNSLAITNNNNTTIIMKVYIFD